MTIPLNVSTRLRPSRPDAEAPTPHDPVHGGPRGHGTTHKRIRRPRPLPVAHLHHCDRFERLSVWTVRATGGRHGFRAAVAMFIVWGATGPYFKYSESWKTVFFVATSSVTFLLVFLASNAQIRSSKALHLKLDELIHAVNKADNALIEAECLAERELDLLRESNRIMLAEGHEQTHR